MKGLVIVMDKNFHLIIRIAVMISAAVGTLGLATVANTALYVLLLLIFLFNTQLRVNVLTGKLALVSLFVDLALVHTLISQGDGVSYILLVISLADALLFFDLEGKVFSVINIGVLTYYLQFQERLVVLLTLLIYVIIIPTILQIKSFAGVLPEGNAARNSPENCSVYPAKVGN